MIPNKFLKLLEVACWKTTRNSVSNNNEIREESTDLYLKIFLTLYKLSIR
jgi:hypothetical protein